MSPDEIDRVLKPYEKGEAGRHAAGPRRGRLRRHLNTGPGLGVQRLRAESDRRCGLRPSPGVMVMRCILDLSYTRSGRLGRPAGNALSPLVSCIIRCAKPLRFGTK